MTQNLESSRQNWSGEPRRPPGRRAVEQLRWPWYRSPWVIATAVLVIFNLFYALPRYLSLDPTISLVMIDPGFPLHYPALVLHVVTGNIAMVTVFLQILPWLRRRSVRFHRISGLLYMYGGALPSAVLALVILPYSLAPTGQVGLFSMAIAWIVTTIAGYQAQRRHRYRAHRRWMAYSFAISLGTSWGRVFSLFLPLLAGVEINMVLYIETTSWLWVLNLLIAHFWLQRRAALNRARRTLQRTT